MILPIKFSTMSRMKIKYWDKDINNTTGKW